MGNRLSRREVVGVWGAAAWVCVRPDSVHYLGSTYLIAEFVFTGQLAMRSHYAGWA